jgi:hypothetical protein
VKLILSLLFTTSLLGESAVFAQSEPVKMSKSGSCHAPGSTYYTQTKNFTPYKTLQDYIKAGGMKPKK